MAEKKIIYMNSQETDTAYSGKEQKKKHRILRKIPYAFAAALLIFAAIVLFSVRQGITVETAKVNAVDFFTGETIDDNFPIETDGLKVEQLKKIGTSTGVLNDVKLYIYSPKGRLINEVQHNMVEPRMVTSKTRALIYEHGNKKIIVASLTKEVLVKQYESEIIAADMNGKNNFAVALMGDRYLSEVHLYNSDGDEELVWYSADNYVVSVAVSPNSSQLAVALFGTVNGENIGSVYIIDKNKSDAPVAEFQYQGETVYSVQYDDAGNLTAVSDEAIYFYDDEGNTIGEYVYTEETIEYFDIGKGKTTVLGFSDYTDGQDTRIVKLDETGSVICELKLSGDISYIGTDKDRLLVIEDSNVSVYNVGKTEFTLEAQVTAEAPTDSAIKAVMGGNGIIVLTTEGIKTLEI